MDEDIIIKPNEADLKEKKKVESQLNSFINPNDKPKNETIDAASYYAMPETKTIPPAEVNINTGVPPKQNRPVIRTYKSDVEETIQTGHVSSVNIALAENKRMMGQVKNTDIEKKIPKINRNILIMSLVLVLGGATAFLVPKYLLQVQYGAKSAPVETVSSTPIITADLQEKININDININTIATTLKNRVDQSATQLGQIKNIYLTEGTGTSEGLITASRFLGLIGANIPSEIQATIKASYMFGLYNYNGNQRFLILKVGDYDTTFSGMLSWETNLWQDFKEVFSLSDNSVSSNNSFSREIIKFQDATFNNKDCRVVKDSSGNIVFLYSIIDPNTIIITTSTNTLREIISRISEARIVTQ